MSRDRSEENETKGGRDICKNKRNISFKHRHLQYPTKWTVCYGNMGGKGINAHTWHEETVYKVDLPANRLIHWAKIESERFANPSI